MSENPAYEELKQKVQELEAINSKKSLVEKELIESEQRYNLLVQNSQTGIYIHVGGLLKFVNTRFAEMLGYIPEEIVGRQYWEFVHPSDREMVMKISLARARGEPAPIKYEFRHQSKDGKTVWVDNLPIIIKYQGQIANMGNLIQINDRKQAEEQTRKLNKLNEHLLSTGKLTDKLYCITDSIIKIFKADFARIWINRPGDLCNSGCVHAQDPEVSRVCKSRDMCLHLVSSSGRCTNINGSHRRVPYGHYTIGQIGVGKYPKIITNDIVNDSRILDKEWARKFGLKSFVAFRLLSEFGNPIGVLAVFSKKEVSSKISGQLEGLGNTASQVIQTALKEEALLLERDKLKKAIQKIKKLSGLLPLCSHCKKVRDDKGYWNQIDAFIQEHSDADISHSICPECAIKYYPDIDIYVD